MESAQWLPFNSPTKPPEKTPEQASSTLAGRAFTWLSQEEVKEGLNRGANAIIDNGVIEDNYLYMAAGCCLRLLTACFKSPEKQPPETPPKAMVMDSESTEPKDHKNGPSIWERLFGGDGPSLTTGAVDSSVNENLRYTAQQQRFHQQNFRDAQIRDQVRFQQNALTDLNRRLRHN